jgi:hypothetical protein
VCSAVMMFDSFFEFGELRAFEGGIEQSRGLTMDGISGVRGGA